jgi:hypothetical protein
MSKKKLFVLSALGLAIYLDIVWSAVAAWPSLIGLTASQWAALPPGLEGHLLALFILNTSFKLGGVVSIALLVWSYLYHRPLAMRMHRVATFWAIAIVGFWVVDWSGLGSRLTVALLHG